MQGGAGGEEVMFLSTLKPALKKRRKKGNGEHFTEPDPQPCEDIQSLLMALDAHAWPCLAQPVPGAGASSAPGALPQRWWHLPGLPGRAPPARVPVVVTVGAR